MKLLVDDDVRRLADPATTRSAMHSAVIAAHRGELVAPPRASVDVGDRAISFTCGGRTGEWFGYRSYGTPVVPGGDEVVVLHDASSNAPTAVAVGGALGPRRVGGIGAVALDALGPAAARRIALIGAGVQGWHQLWALPDRFRDLPIAAYSRTPATRESFATRAGSELGLDVTHASSVADAVHHADIVIIATWSSTPVVTADMLAPDACVISLGPKQVGRTELDPALAISAALVTSDSPAQLAAFDPPDVLNGAGVSDRLAHLGAVLTGEVPVPEGIRVFYSAGLAGTEPWLLDAIARKA